MSKLTVFNIFNVTSSRNREFWYGHLVVLIATVLAVYLAASTGLKTAIEFELIKGDRDGYYMRTALLAEVNDNVEKMESWGKEYRGGQARKFMGQPEDFQLDNFIWMAMRDNPATFEVPGDILTGIRRYYAESNTTLRKMTSKKAAANEVDSFLKSSEVFKSTIVPKLEKDAEGLLGKLVAAGIAG